MQVKILHLVDCVERSNTAEAALRSSFNLGYFPVFTEGDYIQALEGHTFDLVLASFSCPSYDGLEACSYLRQYYPDIPLVFLTSPSEKRCCSPLLVCRRGTLSLHPN